MVFQERKIRLAAARKAVAYAFWHFQPSVGDLPAALLAFASVWLYGIEASND